MCTPQEVKSDSLETCGDRKKWNVHKELLMFLLSLYKGIVDVSSVPL